MEKKDTAPELKNITILFYLEMLFVLIAPIYLWGWLVGLLVHSGLSSLLHIVLLLKHQIRSK